MIGAWVCFGVDEEDGEVGGGVDEPVTGVGVAMELAGEDKTSTEKLLTEFDNDAELSVGDAVNGTESSGGSEEDT